MPRLNAVNWQNRSIESYLILQNQNILHHIKFLHYRVTKKQLSLFEMSLLYGYQKENIDNYTGCPKIIVPCLCGYCGRVVDSSISVFTQLHRSSFNLEKETKAETNLFVYVGLCELPISFPCCVSYAIFLIESHMNII